MAGGITLLSVMLLFFDPLVAIPVHGVVQLVSNGSRTYIQREHVEWWIFLRYAAPLIPMGFVGIEIAQALPPTGLKVAIGVFVLLATWAQGSLLAGSHPEDASPTRRFFVLGTVVGALNTTIGATGPLIAPFFLNLGLTRQGVIGTKAACQTAGHLVKIGVYGVAGFAFAPFILPLLLLSVVTLVGTWIGSRILGHVSETWFVWLYKGVLTAIALRLVVWDGLAVLGLR